ETCASRLSTRCRLAFTTCAVLKAEFKFSLNHMRTCEGGPFLNTASAAGSDRSRIACALTIPGKRSARHTANGAAIINIRRVTIERKKEIMSFIQSSVQVTFMFTRMQCRSTPCGQHISKKTCCESNEADAGVSS